MFSWRRIRWLVFLASLAVDGALFYYADAFTPRSFFASGAGALLLFAMFLEIALHFRGKRRIRSAGVGEEEISYQVGRHLFALLKNMKSDKIAWNAVVWPVLISTLATIGICRLGWLELGAAGPSTPSLVLIQYGFGAYIPLLLAIPFVVEYVSEWSSHQYVVIVDRESREARLIVHHGVFGYNLETVLIERTVTMHVHQTFWETVFAYGDVELKETAGGEPEKLKAVWRPRKLEREIRLAIRASRREQPTED